MESTEPMKLACAAERGPHPVGVATVELPTPRDPDRLLPLEIWYPAAEAEGDRAPAEHPLGAPHAAVRGLAPQAGPRPLVLFSLEGYGFCERGEGAAFTDDGGIELGGRLPVNTSGGGLSEAYVHGFNHIIEGVRQMRGTSPAQVDGAKVSLCHGVGGMFSASGSILFSNEAP